MLFRDENQRKRAVFWHLFLVKLSRNVYDSNRYIKGVLNSDKFILSKTITLMESSLESDMNLSIDVLRAVAKSKKTSIRIGITGAPGVGKSTFIEAFGMYLISLGKKVAVLAIDPSSTRTGGSILGDKTRMAELSQNKNAFIRPSPSGNSLGGVSNTTYESIVLCEAAGFDVIIVETVGVGQSEVMVKDMVDFFLLLLQPGAGDSLQGIKRGIIEMVDGLAINKCDGENKPMAKKSKLEYENALHLFPPSENGWSAQTITCSSLKKTGMDLIWTMILEHRSVLEKSDSLSRMRNEQRLKCFEEAINFGLNKFVFQNQNLLSSKENLQRKVSSGDMQPRDAVNQLFMKMFRDNLN